MSRFAYVLAVAASVCATSGQAEPIDWKGSTDIECGTFYVCLSAEDMAGLVGKKLKYKHPRSEFGTVSVTLRSNGWIDIQNAKGSASGTWEFKDGKVAAKTAAWGEFNLFFFRISDHLFTNLNRDGSPSFLPVGVEN